MKFSVVTASYNQGGFIQRCIDSVVAQQQVDVQHIILDNCSTDRTAEHLNAYQKAAGHVQVQVIVERDAGQTSALNRGFRLATGDVVCWLNTDEWYEADALAKVADFFSRNPEVDVVFGDCDFFDSSGAFMRGRRERGFSRAMLYFYGCYIPSCSTFVRRKVLEDDFFLDDGFRVAMDFEWYARLANAGYRFAHMPVMLACFTWHETNISSTFSKRRLEERRIVQDRYSGIEAPPIVRTVVYGLLRYYWIAIRVLRRRFT
jgi:glycosyltransferase involved in cell wall biosynthesis